MQEDLTKENVFQNKNFVLVFLGALVSNIASLFYSFAVSFYILKISGNNALIQGIYLAAGGVTFCIVSLFGGVISDRFNKAKIMYICDYLKGGLILIFTLSLMFFIKDNNSQIIALIIVNILGNVIAGIFSPASSAILPIIVEENLYQQAQSYFSILNSFQSIVGIILAGILYTLIPTNILFIIVGVCYILSAISEMFIKYQSDFEKKDEKLTLKIVFQDIKDGMKYLSSIKAIMALMFCIIFINFFFSPIFENFSPYFIATDLTGTSYLFDSFAKPEMWNSFFGVALGVGSLVMGIVFSMLKQPDKCNKTVRISMVALAVVIGSLTVSYILFKNNIFTINALLIISVVIMFLIGILLILINVPSSTAMMKIVDKDKFGKVSSVISIASQGLTPLSLLLGGLAITYTSASGLLIICSSGLLIVSLILFFNKKVRDL